MRLPAVPPGDAPSFAIELLEVARTSAEDPALRLSQTFGVSLERARDILARLPLLVKRRADLGAALRYTEALVGLGARVSVREEATGEPYTLDDLARLALGRSPPESGWSAADPAAPGGTPPRAALRTGSQPISPPVPTTLPGTPSAQRRRGRLAPSDATLSADRPAAGPGAPVEERMPLLTLEQSLEAGGAFSGGTGDPLELDESALAPGHTAATVPAMPDLLKRIRDFESTDWEPLKPGAGLSGSRLRVSGATSEHDLDSHAPRQRHPTGPRRRADGRLSGPRPPAAAAPRRSPVVTIALVVGLLALVGAGVLGLVRWLGGVPAELRENLERGGSLYLPSLELVDTAGGRVGGRSHVESTTEGRLGRCYGWIATTEDQGCDLDLYLFGGLEALMVDVMLDNLPVVFHCPLADGQLRLRLANAGRERCRYGLARFEGRGSLGWPLEPYLRLYADYLGALRSGEGFRPVGEVGHGTLETGGSTQIRLHIPEERCYNLLAVSPQGTDLDLRMRVNGVVVAEDVAIDNFPIVGHCAHEGAVTALVEAWMYSGAGPFVHQVVEGRPLQ